MPRVRGIVMRASFGGLAVAAMLSCKNVDDLPPPAAIDGNWNYTEALVDQLNQFSCADTGTYTFGQNGAKFSGVYKQSGVCHDGATKYSSARQGPVTDGAVTDVQLRFTAGVVCTYGGRLSPAHDAVSAGTGICDFVDSATSRHYSIEITWEMRRP